jgi:hypothetical protein
MYVQVITFRLAGIGPEEYAQLCERRAPVFATLPGLLAKVWLTDAAGGTGGGVSLWRDRAALEHYRASEIYAGLQASPVFADMADREYSVLEAPTRITAALAERALAQAAAG